MNVILNDILKVQYQRFLDGKIIKFKNGIEHLVTTGFSPVSLSVFKKHMKKEGVEI